MSENISMTRISDLPEPQRNNMHPPQHQQHPHHQPPPHQPPPHQPPQHQPPQQQPQFGHMQQPPHQQQPQFGNPGQATSFPQMSETNTMYMPLNPHPNPYGIPDQPPGGMIPPQLQNPYAAPVGITQPRPPIDGMPHIGPEHRLPMHDIPMDLADFTHDEQIKPNYIPKPKITSDYIRRHEHATDIKTREYEAEKRTEASRSEWFEALNLPVAAAILFLIYQLPIVNTIIFKRFSFLSIYSDDGNFNLWGLVAKSFLFGISVFSLQQSMQMLNTMV